MHGSIVLLLFLCLFIILIPVFPQEPAELTTERIAENIYILKGGIANSGFIVGTDSVLAIDAGMTEDSAQAIQKAIKETTPKPLSGIILTHSDGDHVNGIGGFPKGLEIYSSIGAKSEMEEEFKAPNLESLREYLPTETFPDTMDMEFGTEKIRLLHFGPAHTSGDSVVFLPEKKVAFIGDLVFVGMDPLIHRHKGGTARGLIKTLQAILNLDADKFVPGHSEVLSKNDVRQALAKIQDTVDKVQSLVDRNKSLEETKKALGIEEPPSGGGGYSFPSLAEVVYLELTENR